MSWLLLIHQLPPKPAYFRVKIWRRLQNLGAVAIKNSVYALPQNEQTLEDFQWLFQEITDGGGEASVCEASFIDGLSDGQIKDLFRSAREEEYQQLAEDSRRLLAELSDPSAPPEARAELATQLRRLKRQYTQIKDIDFFGASNRHDVADLLAEIDARLVERDARPSRPDKRVGATDVVNRTWVTRAGIRVDRIASAWLIRRFIDPQARFKFVTGGDYRPEPGELRFDMFQAEYTHEGDNCTFEVLLDRTDLDDPSLRQIAEIVHDIDLKDGKFDRNEAAGVSQLIDGLAIANKDDESRLQRGSAIFDALYESFKEKEQLKRERFFF